MRPIKQGPLSPKTANATNFAQTFTSTGTAIAPTTLVTDDGLAHRVTLTAPPMQATLAGITFTIVGTDANGKPQTETGLVGPAGGSTVTSTKYFSSIATIQPSATMGGLVVSVGTDQVSISPTIVLDRLSFAAAAIMCNVSGTINFTVQESFANIFDAEPSTLPFIDIAALSVKTADASGTATLGATAVQVVTNAVTNGATYTLYISQPPSYSG